MANPTARLSMLDIEAAANRIKPYAYRTPVFTSKGVNDALNADLHFKCENLQKTAAFKFRGACNAIFSLSDAELARGVATHSSGNHGAAIALAAQIRGAEATVVMPRESAVPKKRAVNAYGGRIVECDLAERTQVLADIVATKHVVPISPFDDYRVIAGQGTAALELLDDVPDLDLVLTPVGGGGLLSGTAVAVKSLRPQAKVVGVEPEQADDAYRSFRAGERIPIDNPNTIADGLRTSVGELTFPIIASLVDQVVCVSEEEIIAAMRLIWERMKLIIEPSAAVPVAAFLNTANGFAGCRAGIILSGGNVDLDALPWLAL